MARAMPERRGDFFISCEPHATTQHWYLIGVDELMNLHGKEAGKKLWEALLSTLSSLK